MQRILVFFVVLAASIASPAHATFTRFTIDPTQSVVTASATLSVDLGPLGTIGVLSLRSQLIDQYGVSGATIGDGTTSDGTRTSLSGTLFADVTAATIRFYTQRSRIEPAVSGSWLPGTPAAPYTPASAQLALARADFALNIYQSAAIRDSFFTFSSAGPLALSGGDSPRQFDAAQTFHVGGGFFDDAVYGRGYLSKVSQANGAGQGTLEDLGGGTTRLTLPVSIALNLDPSSFGGLPFSLASTLTGQIVATPEPGAASLALAALGTLMALRRASRRDRRRTLLGALCVLSVGVACDPGARGYNACTGNTDCEPGLICTGSLLKVCSVAAKGPVVTAVNCAESQLSASANGANQSAPACGQVAAVDTPVGDGMLSARVGVYDNLPESFRIFVEESNGGNQAPAAPVSGDATVHYSVSYTGATADSKLRAAVTPFYAQNTLGLTAGLTGSLACGGGASVAFSDQSPAIVDTPPGAGSCDVQAHAFVQLPGAPNASGTVQYVVALVALATCLSDGNCAASTPYCVDGTCGAGNRGDVCTSDAECSPAAPFCAIEGVCDVSP